MTTRNDKRPRQSDRRRGATSLVEVVVMMSVAMVMLGLSMTTIHLLMRAERHSTQAVWHNTTISRLSRVLREDIHAARDAAVHPDGDDNPVLLNLTLDNDRRIAYSIEEHQLTRVETTGDDVNRQSSFFLPVGSALRFEQTAGAPAAVRLVIQRAPLSGRTAGPTQRSASEHPIRRSLMIQSFVGRKHRFRRQEENEQSKRSE